MSATDLLPCPFCGRGALLQEGDGKFYVACSNAECFVALGERYDRDAMPDHIFYDEEAAASAWNTRAYVAMPPCTNVTA